MIDENIENFKIYLKDNRVGQSSINLYTQALNSISKTLISRDLIKKDLFLISSYQDIEKLLKDYMSQDDLREADKRGHRRISAAIRHYKKFLQTQTSEVITNKIINKNKEIELENNSWKEEELRASVEAYMDMLDKYLTRKKFTKTTYYKKLSQKYGRSVKAYEYRMQNISYVLDKNQREWLKGLKPKKNVGTNIFPILQKLIDLYFPKSNIVDDLNEIKQQNITETQKKVLQDARIGQGKFRKELIKLWEGCSVTGIRNKQLLVASHIKPWKISKNNERLDIYNGLLLIPNIDKLFDIGLISFEDSGIIIISDQLSKQDLINLNINKNMRIKVNLENKKYLHFHRLYVLKK